MSKDDIKWVFYSAIGEIEVWARNVNEVLHALAEHGFTRVDVSKIKQAPKSDNEHEEVR